MCTKLFLVSLCNAAVASGRAFPRSFLACFSLVSLFASCSENSSSDNIAVNNTVVPRNTTVITALTAFTGKDTLSATVKNTARHSYDIFFNIPYGVKPVSINMTSKQFAANGFYWNKYPHQTLSTATFIFGCISMIHRREHFDSSKTTALGKRFYTGTFSEGSNQTFTMQKSQITLSLYDDAKTGLLQSSKLL